MYVGDAARVDLCHMWYTGREAGLTEAYSLQPTPQRLASNPCLPTREDNARQKAEPLKSHTSNRRSRGLLADCRAAQGRTPAAGDTRAQAWTDPTCQTHRACMWARVHREANFSTT
jgi:hypothetical protein